MTDKTVLDGLGAPFTAQLNLDLGPKNKANARVVGLSNEDVALIGATDESSPVGDTDTSGLNGGLKRLAQRLTSILSSITGMASDIADLLTAFNTPATEIPHGALDATSDLSKAIGSRSTSGEESVVSATASQTTRVHRGHITAAGAVTVSLLNGSAGTVLETWKFPAAGAWDILFDSRPYAVTSANTALYLSTDAAVAVNWTLEYVKSA